MKLNIWRIAAIIIISFLVIVIWFILGSNENVRRDNSFLKDEKANLEKKMGALYTQKSSLEKTLLNSKKEKDRLISKINQFQAQNKNLILTVEDIQTKLSGLNNIVSDKEKQIEILKKEIEKYRRSTKELEDRASIFSSDQRAVELPPITVGTGRDDTLDAEILEVNKEYNFVVIDTGRKDGIKEGDILFVFRKNKILGRIVIEKTAADVSIAAALYKSLKDIIKKGDRVSY